MKLKETKQKLILLLKLSATLAILLIVIRIVNVGKIVESFQRMDLYYFFTALALVPLSLSLQLLRWWLLLRNVEPSVTFSETINSFLGGLGISLTTPGYIGEYARVLYIRSDDRWRLTGLVMIDKAFVFSTIVLAATIDLFLFVDIKFKALLFGLGLSTIYFIFNPNKIEKVLRKVTLGLPFKDKTGSVINALNTLDRKLISDCLGLSILYYAVRLGQFFLLLLAFEKVGLQAVLFSFPLMILAMCLPLTIGGLGIREGASVFLLSKFHIAQATALNAAFLLFVINTLTPGIVGLSLISKMKIRGSP